jgi:hypothetical protein
MKKIITAGIGLSIIILAAVSCSKTEKFPSAELSEYMNLQVGKYIRYRLDSTKFINFGQKDTILKYQAKEVIDAAITDNLGRPSWRIIRYLSDTSGTAPWVPSATYMITPVRETVEVLENNLRFQKLKLPVNEGFNWKGNSAIDTYSSNSEVRFMDDWDYTYENVSSSFTVWNNKVVDKTISVNQRDEIIGIPSDPAVYSEKTFSKEVYGEGIGLIYRDFLHWEYQPTNGQNPGYKVGYGIKMVMIDHN